MAAGDNIFSYTYFLLFYVDQKVTRDAETQTEKVTRDAETQTDLPSSIFVPIFIPMFILKIVLLEAEIQHRQNHQQDDLELIADDVSDDENSSLSTNSSRYVNSSEFTWDEDELSSSWDGDELLQTEEEILASLL